MTPKRPVAVSRLYEISEIPPHALGKKTLVRRGWIARDGDEAHYVLEERKYGRYCLAEGRSCPAVQAVNDYLKGKGEN
jgi:hypothetical protein